MSLVENIAPRDLSAHYKAVKARLNKGRAIKRIPITALQPAVEIPIVRIETPKPVLIVRKYPSVREIVAEVCNAFTVTSVDILSHRRQQAVARARQVVMYLARHCTTYSYPEIGRRLDNRDHTTCLHGVQRIHSLVRTDIGLAHSVAHLENHFIEKYGLHA